MINVMVDPGMMSMMDVGSDRPSTGASLFPHTLERKLSASRVQYLKDGRKLIDGKVDKEIAADTFWQDTIIKSVAYKLRNAPRSQAPLSLDKYPVVRPKILHTLSFDSKSAGNKEGSEEEDIRHVLIINVDDKKEKETNIRTEDVHSQRH